MEIKENNTIGEIVANNYKTAKVFESYGIDFCCKGGRTIDDVCESKDLDKSELLNDISKVTSIGASGGEDFQEWPLDKLAEHIEAKHHKYVEEHIPIIGAYLKKLTQVHGKTHPELNKVFELFNASSGELTMHMKKEELILFPYIKKMCSQYESGSAFQTPHFNTVQNPILSMMNEHEIEGERFREISDLTNNYTTPDDGCNTYFVTMNMLRDFEKDLHLHIHLENNILFPKSKDLELKLKNR